MDERGPDGQAPEAAPEVPAERGTDRPSDAASVLARLEALGGHPRRVLLRDTPGEHTPVERRPKAGGPQGDHRYEVLGEIAEGGVGVVYKSRDRDLGRNVAIKVLRREHLDDPTVVARFVEEAQIGGQLQHPGIVPVHELGLLPDGTPFFAMRLVRGKTLSALLAQRARPDEDRGRLLQIFERVAQTVAYAHARGVIHRDLKPANVMIGSFGEVQVVDWGFAKVLGQGGLADERRAGRAQEEAGRDDPGQDDASRIETVRTHGRGSASVGGSLMGTPAYMPPEQAAGRVDDLDERSDVFALGAMLCEILTGLPPYAAEREEVLRQAWRADLDDAMRRLAACAADPDLVDLARRCLAPRREDRPRDAGEVSAALGAWLSARDERAREAALQAAEARGRAQEAEQTAHHERRARHLTLALAAAAVVVVAVVGVAWVARERGRERQAAHATRSVAHAIEEANLLRGEARGTDPEDLARWPAVLAAAGRVVEIAGATSADPETMARAREYLEDVRKEEAAAHRRAEQVAGDRRFARRLLDLRARRGEGFDAATTEASLRAALRDRGLDVEAGSPEGVAALVVQLPDDGVRRAAVAALDELVALRRQVAPADATGVRRLLDVLRLADPDAWSTSVRERAAFGDLEGLRGLAAAPAVESAAPPRLQLLADALGRAGAPAEAVAILRRAQRRDARGAWTSFALGWWMTRTDPPRLDEAVLYLRAAVAAEPALVGASWHLGTVLEARGDVEGAIAAWRPLVDADDPPPFVRPRLAAALRTKAEALAATAPASAMDALREGLRLVPGDDDARLLLARLLSAAVPPMPAEAEATWRELLAHHPDQREAGRGLGHVLEAAGRLDAAAAAYADAAHRFPWDLGLEADLARVERRRGDVAAAAAVWSAAVDALRHGARPDATLLRAPEPDPGDAPFLLDQGDRSVLTVALVELGDARLLGGDAKAALAAYDEADELLREGPSTLERLVTPFDDFGHGEVRLRRAIALQRLERTAEARQAFETALTPDPGEGTAAAVEQVLGLFGLSGRPLLAAWRIRWLALWPAEVGGDLDEAGRILGHLQGWLEDTALAAESEPAAGPSLRAAMREGIRAELELSAGIYRYRRGDAAEAVRLLEAARGRLGEADRVTTREDRGEVEVVLPLYLAMALDAAGRHEEARALHARVLAWAAEQQPTDPLLLFHLDAAAAALR